MKEFQILNIFSLYILRVCMTMHPFIHNDKPVNGPEHPHHYTSTAEIENYPNTRNAQKGHLYQKDQHFIGEYTEIWNRIPEHIRKHKSKEVFKSSIQNYLIKTQISQR